MRSITCSSSDHFDLQQVSSDVWVAIAKDGGAAICNAAIIDLGGPILVFDTFLTPQAAQDLKRAADELFGHSPHLVINSHYHNDHTWGNQVFVQDAQIISSVKTRELILTEGKEELNWYTQNSASKLEANRKSQKETTDPVVISELKMWEGYYSGLVAALPELKMCLPTLTFDHQLEIHGSRGSAKLISYEGAHTGSDTVLYLPQSGVVLLSDLLFIQMHPYLAEGDPFLYIKALEDILKLDASCFVPGHGPVGTASDVKELIDYIDQSIQTAQKLNEEGEPLEDQIAALPVPQGFGHWRFQFMYHLNLKAFCQRFKKTN